MDAGQAVEWFPMEALSRSKGPGGASGAAVETPASYSSNPDLDLAQRHEYGDPEAFNEVYRRYCDMIYNLALRMGGSAERAEDMTQEIFVRVFRHLGRFNGRSTLKTWIYRVALNHCRSRLSRRRFFFLPIAEGYEEETPGVQLIDEGRGPEENALAEDAHRQVTRALAKVKPVFREAVVLRDLEELSYEEIAEILGVRIGTVRSRIARGRDQLRQILEATP
jgi:RNA polymerase sigma-70 factor (ECF subfamily)